MKFTEKLQQDKVIMTSIVIIMIIVSYAASRNFMFQLYPNSGVIKIKILIINSNKFIECDCRLLTNKEILTDNFKF